MIRWLMVVDNYKIMAFRFKLLSTIAMRISRQDIEKKFKKEHIDVSPLALGVMRIIMHDPCTIGELSKRMIIAPASLVPVVETLVEKGYIIRESDIKDRRKSTLHATLKAKNLLKKCPLVTNDDALVKSLKKMGEKKSTQLIQLSEELVTKLSNDNVLCNRIHTIAHKEA